jgi:hypothetical protein
MITAHGPMMHRTVSLLNHAVNEQVTWKELVEIGATQANDLGRQVGGGITGVEVRRELGQPRAFLRPAGVVIPSHQAESKQVYR